MTTTQLVTVAQNYWATHDAINALAQEMRPTGSGEHDAVAFLTRAESLPGYFEFMQRARNFHKWRLEQSEAIPCNRRDADRRFISSFPDPTGQHTVSVLDMSKVVAHFRQHLAEFGRLLTTE